MVKLPHTVTSSGWPWFGRRPTASASPRRRSRCPITGCAWTSPPARNILQQLISRAGHSVTTANCVAQAQQKLAEANFDRLLTDLGLPDGSGLEVIAARHERSDTPAVAMSGCGLNADLARTREAGFAEHIVKLVSAEALRRLLTQFSCLPEPPAPPDRPAGRDSGRGPCRSGGGT